MNSHATALLARITSHESTVGIIGLGYVGLPLALTFAERGFRVLGFDIDPVKVDKLNRGESYIKHVDGGRLPKVVASERIAATVDFSRLGEPDAILICVPTPLTPQREPDMTYVVASAEQIAACLRPGQLVVLESTTYPGTTDQLVRSILESGAAAAPARALADDAPAASERLGGPASSATGVPSLAAGRDFFLAFSPEREDPGNASYGTTNTPKVVGGVDEVSGDLAQALYDQVIERTVRVSSAATAEAAKLTENIFRAVNIALVNELKMVYDRMGIDVWEVLDAAESKPFGFMRFNPGPGWGGHCIPLDPFYLAWKAREHGQPTRFIELAGEVNVAMPAYVIHKLQTAFNERSKPVKGSRVLVLGLAYKKDIDDPRESPSFELIEHLLRLGAVVSYHDPHIPVAPKMRSWPDLPAMHSVALDETTLRQADAVLIATDHSAVDYDLVAAHAALIVDTRGVYRRAMPHVVRA